MTFALHKDQYERSTQLRTTSLATVSLTYDIDEVDTKEDGGEEEVKTKYNNNDNNDLAESEERELQSARCKVSPAHSFSGVSVDSNSTNMVNPIVSTDNSNINSGRVTPSLSVTNNTASSEQEETNDNLPYDEEEVEDKEDVHDVHVRTSRRVTELQLHPGHEIKLVVWYCPLPLEEDGDSYRYYITNINH